MTKLERKTWFYKNLAIFTVFTMLANIFYPNTILAQSGPGDSYSQQSPSGGSSVDPFTGTFSYSIPLLDVEGFPISISYNSDIKMHQEASWVGLGWNLNLGAINRQKRGLPDDFDGDQVSQTVSSKNERTDGSGKGGEFNVSASLSYGFPNMLTVGGGANFGASWMRGDFINSHKGFGEYSRNTFTAGVFGNVGAFGVGANGGAFATFGFDKNTQNGVGFNASGGVFGGATIMGQNIIGGAIGGGTSTNSRQGTKMNTTFAKTSLFTNSTTRMTMKNKGYPSFTPKLGSNLIGYSNNQLEGYGLFLGWSFEIGDFNLGINLDASALKEKYFSGMLIKDKTVEVSSYGYLNLQNSPEDQSGLLDFNREKEHQVSPSSKLLPSANLTYDLFQVSGPGIGGVFRAFRNDIGTIGDPVHTIHVNDGYSRVDKKAWGTWFKHFHSDTYTDVITSVGRGNGTAGNGRLKWVDDEDVSNRNYEEAYFKFAGEMTPNDESLVNQLGGINPIQLGYYGQNGQMIEETAFYENNSSTGQNIPTQNYDNATDREIRATQIKKYSQGELKNLNFGTQLRIYDILDYNNQQPFTGYSFQDVDKDDDSYRKDHHISLIDVTTTNGATYRYGVPVYSIEESDVSFSIADGDQAYYQHVNTLGLVGYQAGVDNSINNKRGYDNKYEKVTTPGYASSFLLSEVYSSNYVDVTGNGPSIDDIGSYVRMNYSRQYGGDGNSYEWRLPYSERNAAMATYPRAHYHQGQKSDPYDDMAFYNHGEKEVWYVHTVETKNYIAEFYLDNRDDAMSVKDENGEFLSNKQLKCLKKIVLYNREDRLRNQQDATPLKTVEFVYDYSLCKDFVGNINYLNGTGGANDQGKLTLKEIKFSSGNSEEYSLTPYKFEYSDRNPNFNNNQVNRWGNFKFNDINKPNWKYPYVDEAFSQIETNCSAWKLTKITQPTGGTMEITYEPQRYSYIQDKRTMKFFKIIKAASDDEHDSNFTSGNINQGQNKLRTGNHKTPRNYLYFELDENISGSTYQEALEEFKRQYFDIEPGQPLPDLYYNFDVSIQAQANDNEHMNGFLASGQHLSHVGLIQSGPNGEYGHGFIKLADREIGYGDNNASNLYTYDMNILQKLFIQYVRVHLPQKIYADDFGGTSNGEPTYLYHNDYDGLGITDDATKFLHRLNKDHFCQYFNPDESFIRMYNPSNIAYTGDGRVSKVKVSDNWQSMSNEDVGEYTTVYTYDDDPEGKMPTSGVASWDPMNGHEISPFFKPQFYTQEHFFIPTDFKYQAEVMGESHLPAPMVGYSQVTREFEDIADVNITAMGKSVSRYNTSKDYPYKFRRTNVKFSENDEQDLQNGVSRFSASYSQGYTIEINDFHGKPKQMLSYDELGNVVSSTTYEYFGIYDKQKVVDRNGQIYESNLAREIDVIVDKNHSENYVEVIGTSQTETVPLIPIPSFDDNDTYLQSFETEDWTVVTKVVSNYAKIKKVKTYSLGNSYESKVLAYDKYSGNPISMNNSTAFNDWTYGLAIPSYWKYKELQNKYEFEDIVFTHGTDFTDDANGKFNILNDIEKFHVGDYIQLKDVNGYSYYHVLDVDVQNGKITLIDENGDGIVAPSNMESLTIVWSGVKNRINESMMSVGQLGTNPIGNVGSTINIDEQNILSADATEYKYNIGLLCNTTIKSCGTRTNETCGAELDAPLNPFYYGLYSNIYPTKNYVYKGELNNSQTSVPINNITDGKFINFLPFYANVSNEWVDILNPSHPNYDANGGLQNWRLIGDATRWDEFGRVVETKDALGRHSVVLYGYSSTNKLVPVATSFNAKINQIAYDGFEGESYFDFESGCPKQPHFSFENGSGTFQISSDEKHTGNHSIQIAGGNYSKVSSNVGTCAPTDSPPDLDPNDGLYYANSCNCLPIFTPDAEETYFLSLWTKEELSIPDSYSSLEVEVVCRDLQGNFIPVPGFPSGVQSFGVQGKQIDGWQKIEGKVQIPTGAVCIDISLKNNGTNLAYFDDFRFHPYRATMVTAVFDDKFLLPMASLNSNNYATIYHYDENLSLSRIMKESTDGKQTVAQFKGGIFRNQVAQP